MAEEWKNTDRGVGLSFGEPPPAQHGDDLRVIAEIFAGETHMSVLPAAVNRAVQAAFAACSAD